MPKCKFCVPYRSGENYCNLSVPEVLKEEQKKGNLVVCEENVFPGFEFCPKHLDGCGLSLTKLTADYIANKEE